MPTPYSVLCSLAPFRLVNARHAVALLATTAALALTACGDDDDGPTGGGGVAGTYNIVSATGLEGTDTSAPFLLLDETIEGFTFRLEIVSGAMTLNGNGTFAGTQTMRTTLNGVPETSTETDAGTYTVSGSTITLVANDDPTDPDDNDPADRTTSATLSGGNTLTFSEPVDLDDDGEADATFTLVARK